MKKQNQTEGGVREDHRNLYNTCWWAYLGNDRGRVGVQKKLSIAEECIRPTDQENAKGSRGKRHRLPKVKPCIHGRTFAG